jgi:hypothetical protein
VQLLLSAYTSTFACELAGYLAVLQVCIGTTSADRELSQHSCRNGARICTTIPVLLLRFALHCLTAQYQAANWPDRDGRSGTIGALFVTATCMPTAD